MADPKTAEFAVFEGIKAGNRFYSLNCPDEDQTRLSDGTVAYRILGYADTPDEALDIIEGSNLSEYIESQRRAREMGNREMFGDNIPPEVLLAAELEVKMLSHEVAKRQLQKLFAFIN